MDADEFRAAIRSGDPLAAFSAIRDRLAEGVLEADDKRLLHLAPTAKQLMDVLDKINALEGAKPQGDVLDDLVARRAARRPAS